MSFIVTENNEGYDYKDIYYKWGEGLIQLVNYDLTNFSKAVEQIVKNSNTLIESNNNITPKVDIEKFFHPLLIMNNSSSIHIDLIKEYLFDFFDAFDNRDFEGNLITYNIDELLMYLKNLTNPIFIAQKIYKNVFYKCFGNKIKQEQKVSLSNDILKLINMNDTYSSKLYTPANIIRIVKNSNKGDIKLENSFYNVYDFCRYEFFKLLEKETNILKCPNCNNYFIVKHRNAEYCSEKCRKIANDKKIYSNPYFVAYNKKYKQLENHYLGFGKKAADIKPILQSLKEIYNKYKQRDTEKFSQSNFDKFRDELEKIS